MQLGKNSNIQGKWVWISLTEEESKKALEEVLHENIEQTRNCVFRCSEEEIGIEFTKIILDKQLTASFTALNNALDRKINAIKDGKYTTRTGTETFKKAQATTENKLKEQPKIEGKSLIEKSFEEKTE
jgi:hypothetical protein